MTLRLRSARPGEVSRLTEIAHAAKRHWGYPETLLRLWRADLTVRPDFVTRHPTCAAVESGTIVGFYALSRDGERFELEHCWVDPTFMRRGVGTALFAHALDTVRALGGVRLTIASDPNAEGFYRRMGARRVGEVPSRLRGRMLPLLSIELERPTQHTPHRGASRGGGAGRGVWPRGSTQLIGTDVSARRTAAARRLGRAA